VFKADESVPQVYNIYIYIYCEKNIAIELKIVKERQPCSPLPNSKKSAKDIREEEFQIKWHIKQIIHSLDILGSYGYHCFS
jgi:hypothetical protein